MDFVVGDFFFASRMKYGERFLNADGTPADFVSSAGSIVLDAVKSKKDFILTNVGAGRYEIECWWNNKEGHLFIIERHLNGNLIFYDPQTGTKSMDVFDKYLDRMKAENIKVMRIDDKLINTKLASRFILSQ